MKRRFAMALAVLCVYLTGCGQLPAPERAADGLAWSDGWANIGNVVGIDVPEGVDTRENNDALAGKGMYYATWSIGEESAYTSAGGDEAKIYDAQFYLLLAGYDSVEKAEEALADWQSLASSQYAVEETGEAVYNGQSFTVMTYSYQSETNPYQRGASAFGIYRNYALSVELSCLESYEGDARTLLESFLERCHYAA